MYLVCQRGSHGEAWPTRNHDRTGRREGDVTGAVIMMPTSYFESHTLPYMYSALWQSFGVLTPTIHVIFTVQCH